jgi:very-short-patch-repair endonuclease
LAGTVARESFDLRAEYVLRRALPRDYGRRVSPPELDAVAARLAQEQDGAFACWQILAAGGTNAQILDRVRSGRWVRVHRGVYRLAGTPVSWRLRMRAALLVAGEGAMLSHMAAAKVHGMPVVGAEPVVTVPAGRRVRVAGLAVHRARLGPEESIVRSGLPVTSIARTLGDLAGERFFSGAYLHELLDDVLRRRQAGLVDLRSYFRQDGRGRPGDVFMRGLVEARVPATRSRLETLAMEIIEAAGLRGPTPDVSVQLAGRLFRTDLAYEEARVAIELDGLEYHDQWALRQRDYDKDNALNLLGWIVLRVTFRMLTEEPEAFVVALRAALSRAGQVLEAA